MRGVLIRIMIVTRYLHPRGRLEDGFLQALTGLSDSEFLIFMGDLNGRMGLVPGEGTNAIRISLLDQIEDMGFLVLNNEQPTYISTSNSSQASLDVCLVRTRQRDKLSWKTLDSVGSDHLPTELTINFDNVAEERKLILKTDWEHHRLLWNESELQVPNLASKDDIDRFVEELSQEMIRIKNSSTNEVKRLFRGDKMLSKESREFIKMRRKDGPSLKIWKLQLKAAKATP